MYNEVCARMNACVCFRGTCELLLLSKFHYIALQVCVHSPRIHSHLSVVNSLPSLFFFYRLIDTVRNDPDKHKQPAHHMHNHLPFMPLLPCLCSYAATFPPCQRKVTERLISFQDCKCSHSGGAGVHPSHHSHRGNTYNDPL